MVQNAESPEAALDLHGYSCLDPQCLCLRAKLLNLNCACQRSRAGWHSPACGKFQTTRSKRFPLRAAHFASFVASTLKRTVAPLSRSSATNVDAVGYFAKHSSSLSYAVATTFAGGRCSSEGGGCRTSARAKEKSPSPTSRMRSVSRNGIVERVCATDFSLSAWVFLALSRCSACCAASLTCAFFLSRDCWDESVALRDFLPLAMLAPSEARREREMEESMIRAEMGSGDVAWPHSGTRRGHVQKPRLQFAAS